MRVFSVVLASILAIVSTTTSAQSTGPLIDYGTRFIPAIASKGIVSGPEELASEAGLDMLKQGGNAIDAAVATGFALAVTLPRAGNIGGGGFMLVHLAETDEQIFIDYREMAPSRASRNMFLNEDGSVNQAKAYNSTSAAGVPGTVAGMIHALEQYGTMDLATVIQPAIDLAEKGFEVPAALHLNLRAGSERLSKNEEAKRVYLQGTGEAPAMGSCSNNPTLPPPSSAFVKKVGTASTKAKPQNWWSRNEPNWRHHDPRRYGNLSSDRAHTRAWYVPWL